MRFSIIIQIIIYVEIILISCDEPDDREIEDEMSIINISEFVARVKGGERQARRIAKNLDLKLIRKQESEPIGSHNRTDLNRKKRSSKRRRLKRSVDFDEINKLKSDPSIEWVQQQTPKSRKKRDFISFLPNEADDNLNMNIFKNSKYNSNNFNSDGDLHSSSKSGNIKFNDPMWSKLWYINPQEKYSNSMRIKEAWQRGFTGKGVVVTILDDGLEWDHPDLIKNYDFRASLDINDSDNDPKPRYDRYNYNKHGTRCAGEIAAVADNEICSVGVAYNSHIGGIRMLDGEVTDLVEATALSYNRDYIDIYSASWGPDDDGKTVDGPGFLALKAIEDGIKYGRRGLGSIYVWASGNGGKDDDNCNCDGYTNSIYTISISSATQNGNIPWYSEACSSTIASTFSSGSYEERQIITTDLRKSCTEAHTGTSASAPLAAGIIALTLEANPELSWRDIQHIIVETAKSSNLSSPDWQLNGANRRVSHSFGYGMMDAVAMIDIAKTWTNVPHQRKCVIESSQNGHHQKPILIPKGDRLIIELFSTGCRGSKNEINYLEHVQAVISVQSNSRGTLVVYLRSPMGTNSTLLDRRMLDQSTESFNKWPFTTVHMWGEAAQGTWTLEIKNNAKNTTYLNLNLILYGTKESPQKRAVPSNPDINEMVYLSNLQNIQNTSSQLHLLNQPTQETIDSSSSPIFNIFQDQRNRKAKLSHSSSLPINPTFIKSINKCTKYKAETRAKNPKLKIKQGKSSTTSTTTTTTTTTTTPTTTTTINEAKSYIFVGSNSRKYGGDYINEEDHDIDDDSSSIDDIDDEDDEFKNNYQQKLKQNYNDYDANRNFIINTDEDENSDEMSSIPTGSSNNLIGIDANGGDIIVSNERSSIKSSFASSLSPSSFKLSAFVYFVPLFISILYNF